jgi:hypothetical protein
MLFTNPAAQGGPETIQSLSALDAIPNRSNPNAAAQSCRSQQYKPGY